MMLSIIAAVSDNGVIGIHNRLPWHLPADLKHFRAVTMGKPILMGRRTYESIGRPLPGRKNIVLSLRPGYTAEGCTVVNSVEGAIAAAGAVEELMIIGGSAIYAALLPEVDRIYLTQVHDHFEGHVFFPDYDEEAWREISREDHEPDEKNAYAYSFVVLERKNLEHRTG